MLVARQSSRREDKASHTLVWRAEASEGGGDKQCELADMTHARMAHDYKPSYSIKTCVQ